MTLPLPCCADKLTSLFARLVIAVALALAISSMPGLAGAATADFVLGAPQDGIQFDPDAVQGTGTTNISTTTTISTAGLNGFTGDIDLSVSGLDGGLAASLSPTTVRAGQSAILTISASDLSDTGMFTLTITGKSGSLLHTTDIPVMVGQCL